MAGVEFAKYGGSALGELSVHFDNEIRADEKTVHSNVTINKELTYKNYYIGADSYQEIVEKIDNIIEEADAKNPPKRVRKDRKVWFSLEVPCPPELEGTDQEDIFYKKVFEMYKEYLPGLVGGVVNKDEKHEYLDSKKGWVISRNHAHFLGASLTKDGRINTHDLITKEMCQKVNDDIQELCLKEWGISYQTGEGRQGAKKTVEQLKSESAVRLQEKLAKEGLDVVYTMRQEKDTLQGELKEKTADLEKINSDIKEKSEEARLTGLEADYAEYRKATATADFEKINKENEDLKLETAINKNQLNKINADIVKNGAIEQQITENLEKLTHSEIMQDLADPQKQPKTLALLCQKSAKYDQIKKEKENLEKLTEDYNKYKNIAENIPDVTLDDIEKAYKNEYITNRELSEMIKNYAIKQNDGNTNSILKTCVAMDKIDAYKEKSYLQRNKVGMERAENHNFKYYDRYDKQIRKMLKKSLKYEDRTEIYQQNELKNLWADIKADNQLFWEDKKSSHKEEYQGYISLDKVFTAIIPRLIQTAVQAIKSYIEMIKQAQNEEEHER
jgi:hypothetical protein